MRKTITKTLNIDLNVIKDNSKHKLPIYTKKIKDEEPKPITPRCFSGSIYRKVVSSRDYWLGIEALITLPEFIPDPERIDSTAKNYFLDVSSIYMGGNAESESDVGLAWRTGYRSYDSKELSKEAITFRPFWRYITETHQNFYCDLNPHEFEFYYYPGDTIRMSVYSPKPGFMQMRIELIKETENQKYKNERKKYNLDKNFNHVFFTSYFPSKGMGVVKSEFKRVNAIDQTYNEGKPTINTNSLVKNVIWHEVYLYRKIDGSLYKVPFTKSRSASMTCPLGVNENGDFSNAFEISYDGVDKSLGGEIVTLNPNNGTGKLYNQ